MENATFNSALKGLAELLCDIGDAVLSEPLPDLLASVGWPCAEGLSLSTAALSTAVRQLRLDLAAVDFSRDMSSQAVPLLALSRSVADVISKIAALGDDLPAPTGSGAGEGAANLARRLFDTAVAERLQLSLPLLFAFLSLVGAIETVQEGPSAERRGFCRRELHLDKLGVFLRDPGASLAETVGWGAALDWRALLGILEQLLHALGVPAGRRPVPSALGTALFLDPARATGEDATILVAPLRLLHVPLVDVADEDTGYVSAGVLVVPVPRREGTDKQIRGLALVPYASAGLDLAFDLGAGRKLEVTGDFRTGVAIRILPGEVTTLAGLDGGAPGSARALVRFTGGGGGAWDTLFSFGGLRVERGAFDVVAEAMPGEVRLQAGAQCRAVLDTSGGDSLVGRLLPASLETPFDVAVGWSSLHGVHFVGSADLSIEIPLSLSLGGLNVESLALGVVSRERGLAIRVAASASAALGPARLRLDRVGFEAGIDFDGAGREGAPAGEVLFVPPTGVELALDASGVRGAGRLDIQDGRYSGAFELTVQERVSVQAAGVILTRTAEGTPTFSFKLLGTADFGAAPIPLGAGFSLFGLGLALAIECTMNAEALRRATYDGSLRSLLFPPDLARNAAQVLSDLDAFFPPKKGAFVVGAMAKLGWGGGVPLVQADVGVFVAWDEGLRVALAGTVSADLPDSVVPILRLRAQALGILDFAARSLSIDASLAGSSILDWALDGGLALRAEWGDAPRFALSAGGFFPGYAAPPGFPALRRVSLAIGTDNPRVSLEGYFAVTESSVQLGARVDLLYRKSVFILGDVTVSGRAGFDALLQLAPLHFEVGMYAGCEVTAGDFTLFGVDVAMTLAGPNPYHVTGTATVEILGIDLSVDFDETFGATRPEVASTLRVAELVAADLKEPRNWQVLQGGAAAPVRVREGAAGADPRGRLRFSQRRVPFGVTITWAGGARVSGDGYFDVTFAGSATPVLGAFAPGQYLDLTNEQKISAVPFESFKCGLDLGEGADLRPDPVEASMDYETLLPGSTTPVASPVSAGLEEAQSALDRRRRLPAAERYEMSADFGVVEISPPRFVVTGAPGGPTPGATWAEAFVRARDLRRSSARAAAGEGRVRRARARAER